MFLVNTGRNCFSLCVAVQQMNKEKHYDFYITTTAATPLQNNNYLWLLLIIK